MWWLRIIALNALSGVVELLYAVEGAYFVPAIYDKGLSLIYGSMLLCLSPIMGVLFQSYFGSASDQCKCRWGKRRPFILALTLTCICGLILFPFTENISNLLNGRHLRFVVLLILTVLATTITDFSVGALYVPGKAYLLDVLPTEYTKFGNIVASIWTSAGATVGFGIGAKTWSSNFNTQVLIVCGISLVITIVCIALTLFSVNEQNPQLKLKVASESGHVSTIVNSDHEKAIQQPAENPTTINELSENKEASLGSTIDCDAHNEFHENIGTDDSQTAKCGCKCFDGFVSSISGNIQFIRCMSLSMIILCFALFFAFLAVFTQMFFLTDFVAGVIYNGDVMAPENSTAYHKYTKGVKVGSLALGVSAIASLVVSLLSGPLMKLFGMRLVFVFPFVFTMVQSGVMIFSHSVITLFVLSPALYCMITILLLIPFILISQYETNSILLQKPWPYADKNLLGRACSILMMAMLSSEVVALLINGPLRNLYGSAVSVMIISCASSFIGAVIACFVRILPEDSKNTEITNGNETKDMAVTESTKLLHN